VRLRALSTSADRATAFSSSSATFSPGNVRPLAREFFARTPQAVARELLGKVLMRGEAGEVRAGRIVETEAYLGENDPAAHSAAGRTARNAVLFGPPGYAYVYFIYGTHYCLNVSCDREGKAGGILFRALEPLAGLEAMARARKLPHLADSLSSGDAGLSKVSLKDLRSLTSGPGRLAAAFSITRARDNGCDLTSRASGLWIGEDDFSHEGITVGPRIGITKAAEQPLRYFLTENRFVSGTKR
jgi:DNA-3-methyladenine glycosylase